MKALPMNDQQPSAPIILVCGFGRCGSSLVMQMLAAGGVPMTGEWPAFEADQVGDLALDADWLATVPGHAIKLLDPHRAPIPAIAGGYRSIWLDRDPREQSRSHAKFLRLMMGIHLSRIDIRRFAASYSKDRPKALAALHARGWVCRLRFEDVLADPVGAATTLAAFVGVSVENVRAMASAVRPRLPSCAGGLDMELALLAERSAEK